MKINENVYMLDCTKFSHSYVIVNEDVTLIDTSVPKLTREILSELTSYKICPNEVKRILLTHHDIDHIGNAAELSQICECPVYISAKDYPCVTGIESRSGIKKILGHFMKAEIPKNLNKITDNVIKGIQALPTPGHTKGHTCYRCGNVLFTGDLIAEKNGRITTPPLIMTWNKGKLIESFLGLNLEGIEWICPAHGNPVSADTWHTFIEKYR